MSTTEQASNAADFTPEQCTVALPRRNAAGTELRVTIRALKKSDVLAVYGGLPSRGGVIDVSDLAPQAIVELEAQVDERIREVVKKATVSPAVATAIGEEGVLWDDVHSDNQKAWFNAILDQSGLRVPQEADALLAFRVLERGGIPLSQ